MRPIPVNRGISPSFTVPLLLTACRESASAYTSNVEATVAQAAIGRPAIAVGFLASAASLACASRSRP
ncbi:hypothetical protein MELA_00993 [Candidatus Methylomirabilis lanthanidiphila]|uniref:Uncharacterized protein n=1 Tax=Candidatus Methylomirabilis lanthanidiphila TaxID=2211376 RepID=A0A564ZH08_9BACT|nr:hypothetical protein MELA_00993 [Candidatus Methylomirabilis lanthanidiphila]